MQDDYRAAQGFAPRSLPFSSAGYSELCISVVPAEHFPRHAPCIQGERYTFAQEEPDEPGQFA